MTAATEFHPQIRAGGRLKALTGIFRRQRKSYINPYIGGVLLGLVLFGSFFLTGSGLGASGGIARYVSFLVDLVAPEHVDRVPAWISFSGGDRNALDNWIVLVTTGALLGGFVSGVINGRTRFETHKGPNISNRTRWVFAFLGGIFFTYGARLARGCTSGQALSGGATLAAGSWAVMLAIFGGAYALAYFARRLWN